MTLSRARCPATADRGLAHRRQSSRRSRVWPRYRRRSLPRCLHVRAQDESSGAEHVPHSRQELFPSSLDLGLKIEQSDLGARLFQIDESEAVGQFHRRQGRVPSTKKRVIHLDETPPLHVRARRPENGLAAPGAHLLSVRWMSQKPSHRACDFFNGTWVDEEFEAGCFDYLPPTREV